MSTGDEAIAVPREVLQGIFDLAVNSLDFGSGFWDHEDEIIARTVAVLLGVDPARAVAYRSSQTLYAHPDGRFHGAAHCPTCRGQGG